MSVASSLGVFRHKDFRWFWINRVLAATATRMASFAIAFQAYDIARMTRPVGEAAFILGLVGLTQFLVLLAFSLFGGQAADRLNRKFILVYGLLARAAVFFGLLAVSLYAPGLAS